jgi:FkbM family methyltransferase
MITVTNEWINKIPIVNKIYQKIMNTNLVKKQEFPVFFKNIKLCINIKDPIDKMVFYKNQYEEEQINFLVEWIKKNKPNVFIDVGANFGIYSLRISKLFPKLKIIAFEPVVTTFNKFKKHIKINNLEKKIKTYNVGLSNDAGNKKMIALKRKGYAQSGGASFNIPKRKFTDEDVFQYCKTIIGDKILKFKNKKIILKIDVERYENNVLLGIKNLLNNNNILLQIEILDDNFTKINKLLLDNKFKLIKKFDKTYDYFYINY